MMKKIKWIIIILSGALTLSIILLSFWLYQLSQSVSERIQNKKFLPPTEYYSAPEKISIDMKLTLNELLQKLNQRGYRERAKTEELFFGDYKSLSLEECKTNLPADWSEESYLDSASSSTADANANANSNINISATENTSANTSANSILSQKPFLCVLLKIKETQDPELVDSPIQVLLFAEDQNLLDTFSEGKKTRRALLEPELFAQYLSNEPISQSYVSLGEIPPACLNGVLAIEDAHFLEHKGVSYTGLLRAAFANIFKGKLSQGGSTITQQMVKNFFLTSEKTIKRKFYEFFIALILEYQIGKDEILDTYLNIIYMGQNGSFQIRGFPSASQYYFNKEIKNLELHECSLLAAVLNSPGLWNPFTKPDKALKRRNLVLQKMETLKMITEVERVETEKKELGVIKKTQLYETAPFYINAVNNDLKAKGIENLEGLKLYTGLDLRAQAAAQEALQSQIYKLEADRKLIKANKEKGFLLEGLLISADNEEGLIIAAVGGRNYKLTQFNRLVDSHRQIGSIMKPFVYLAALMEKNKNYTPTTSLSDKPFTHPFGKQKWTPENYGGKYYDEVPMYFALKNSLNCATASLGLSVGLDPIVLLAKALGITSKLEPLPSITLGSFELYPREVLNAYMTFARLGHSLSSRYLRSVLDSKLQVIWKPIELENLIVDEEKKENPLFDSTGVAVLVGMMKQTVLSGTAKAIKASGFMQPAAGKTGTTSDNKDSWFAGFTPMHSTVVWLGYDNNKTHGLTGGSGAVPIWIDYMKKIEFTYKEKDFSWPKTVETRKYFYEKENEEVELIFKKEEI